MSFLFRHREPKIPQTVATPLALSTLTQPWREPKFRRYVALSAFFSFGWQLSWPLFNIFQIGHAHATGLWIGLFAMSAQVAQILTFRWWGRTARLWGGWRTLGVAGMGISVVPVLTVLSVNFTYLTLINF